MTDESVSRALKEPPDEAPFPPQRNEEKLTIFQYLILILSILVLAVLFVESITQLPERTLLLLNKLDTLICFVFLYDFFARLWYSENRRQFLKWNWIDLVSSIPMIEFLRWGRAVRVIRIFRLLRAFRSLRYIMAFLFRNRARWTLSIVGASCVLLLVFSSVAILTVETENDSTIRTPEDALWWCVASLTSANLDNKYPVTSEGRAIAVVLFVVGVGLVGTVSGFLASYFIEPDQYAQEKEIEKVVIELATLRSQLDRIERNLSPTITNGHVIPGKEGPEPF